MHKKISLWVIVILMMTVSCAPTNASRYRKGNPYHYTFTVVDVADVNAFAMPAGTIFVTAPLIALASSEAELAGVVSYEIGHVVARHTAERMSAMEKAQNKTWIYATGGAAGYDKDQVGNFYKKLLEIERKSGRGDGVVIKNLADAMSTHPPSEERVRQMQGLAAQSPDRPSITNTQPFKRAKQIAAKLDKK